MLLLIPLVALLAIPLYNSINPTLGGVPFFYWYQLLWMPLGALLYYIASVIWNEKEKQEESEKRKAARKSSSRKRSKR